MTPKDALPATIPTPRLTLRAPSLTDADDIVAQANNPKMVETTATLPFPYASSDALTFIADTSSSAGQRAYAIADVDDRFIGTVLFKFAEGGPPEIGYWLGEAHWGKGYAGEAVGGLIAAARNLPGFAQIDARVLASNPASIRVLEKAGFAVIERTNSVVERHRGQPLLVMRWEAR